MCTKISTFSLLTAIICGLLVENAINAKTDFELAILNHTCRADYPTSSTFVAALNCGLSKNTRRRTLMMEMTFNRDIDKFHVNLNIVLPRRGANDFVLMNLTKIDGCQILSNKNQNTLMQLGRKYVDRFSNFPKECPFRKNELYYIRGFRMDMDAMPAFNMESDMVVSYEYIVEQKAILSATIKVHIGVKRNKKATMKF